MFGCWKSSSESWNLELDIKFRHLDCAQNLGMELETNSEPNSLACEVPSCNSEPYPSETPGIAAYRFVEQKHDVNEDLGRPATMAQRRTRPRVLDLPPLPSTATAVALSPAGWLSLLSCSVPAQAAPPRSLSCSGMQIGRAHV